MQQHSRREFGRSLVRLLPTYALLQYLFANRLFAARVAPEAARWVRERLSFEEAIARYGRANA